MATSKKKGLVFLMLTSVLMCGVYYGWSTHTSTLGTLLPRGYAKWSSNFAGGNTGMIFPTTAEAGNDSVHSAEKHGDTKRRTEMSEDILNNTQAKGAHVPSMTRDMKNDSLELRNNSKILVQSNTYSDRPPRRYLLSVHHDGNGPNCQYQAFRGAMRYAMAENRTLVEMWFRNHGSAGSAYGGRKFVNETFDVDSIKEVVDLVSVEKFRKACNGTADAILMDPFSIPLSLPLYMEQYELRRNRFTTEYSIALPGVNTVPMTPSETYKQFEKARTVECLAYFEPDRMSRVSVPAAVTRQVDLHLIRTPQIRKLAEKISKEICNGKPFICMHWRNRSGEVAHCPSVTRCKDLNTVINVNKTAVVLAEDVKKLMSERKLECIYVAFPPLGERIVKIMKNAQIRNVVTRKDITGDSYPVKLPEHVRLDNYHTALLEQEICIRSHLFLSHYSSLSKMIRDARDTQPGLEYIHLSNLASWKAPGVVLKRRKL